MHCVTCLMHESECSFMLLNVCEDRNIKFDIIKTILMQKKGVLILVIYYLMIFLEACHII